MPLYTKDGKSVFYVHVPKTGGTAIETFFEHNGFEASYFDGGGAKSLNRFRQCAPQHMDAAQIKQILRPAKFDYFFMTVRHPLRRLMSEYRMHVRVLRDVPSLSSWFESMARRYLLDSYVAENHIRPQVEFWMPTCEVYRQEDGFGEALVERIEQKLEVRLQHRKVGVYNRDDESDAWADIAPVTEQSIRQFYREDFIRFHY